MRNKLTDLTSRSAAKLAGIGYVILFVLGIFANFVVREGLIDPGNASATLANVRESETLFRWGLLSFLVIFLVDVAVAWLLHILFREVSREVSLVTAWFRLVYTVFLGVAVVFFFVVLVFVGGADYLTAFDPGQIEAQVVVLSEAFNYAWMIGLLSFGIHLILLGYLVMRSIDVPRALGVVLLLAGAGYVIDTTGLTVLSNYADYEGVFLAIVAIPSIVGEFAFTLWLLLRAGKRRLAPA